MKLVGRLVAAVGLVGIVLATTGAVGQDMKFFRITSGSAGGTYFPISGLIANAISSPPGSRSCEEGGSCGVPGLVAIAQSSNASVANVTAVQSGEVESGLASADIVYTAYNGEGKFESEFDKLRVIANLFPEHMQLVLPSGAKLSSLADLKGRRVGIGQAGSGTQVVVLQLLELFDITKDDIFEAELNNNQSAERMADGQLDAFFYVAGTPTASMVQLAATKGMELYSFSEDERKAFLKAVPFYYNAVVPAGTYEGIDYDVDTLAVGAQWVTSADQPEELIYEITKAMWNENSRKLFDNGHAKGKSMRLESALNAVLTPLHAGAQKFYQEAGILK